jgi:hypothetical protein
MSYQIQYGTAQPNRYAGTFLFVVSHMRSYSSLLCHILGSHREISGYSEANLSYSGRSGLRQLEWTVRDRTGEPTLNRFLLDKVLHNDREIAPDVLRRPDVRCIFLLRNARDTIASILNLARVLGGTGEYPDASVAAGHYAPRLAHIERYGSHVAGRAIFVESERLLDDTDAQLARLAQWLDLAEPLSPEYRTFRYTGVFSHGDPSPHIKTGKVVSDAERHRDYVPIAIADDVLERCNAAYARCRAALSQLR